MTMKDRLINCLKMHPLTGDLAQSIEFLQGKLRGIMSTDADYLIAAGDDEFPKQRRLMEQLFQVKTER